MKSTTFKTLNASEGRL